MGADYVAVCSVCDHQYRMNMRKSRKGVLYVRSHCANGVKCPGAKLPALPPRPGRLSGQSMADLEVAVYRAILAYKVGNDGVSPSIRELVALTGAHSTSTVHTILRRLRERGIIRMRAGISRGISVTSEALAAYSSIE